MTDHEMLMLDVTSEERQRIEAQARQHGFGTARDYLLALVAEDIETDEDDLALVTAIIQMAHGLKLKAVAEGVETLAQLALLKALGCDEFQGYLVSRTLPAEHLKPFISQ